MVAIPPQFLLNAKLTCSVQYVCKICGNDSCSYFIHSVFQLFQHCWFVIRKNIRPVKLPFYQSRLCGSSNFSSFLQKIACVAYAAWQQPLLNSVSNMQGPIKDLCCILRSSLISHNITAIDGKRNTHTPGAQKKSWVLNCWRWLKC